MGPALRHDHDLRLTIVIGRVAAVLLSGLLVASAAPAGAGAAPGRSVGARLAASLESPALPRERTAALALDLATGMVVFAHNERMPLVPASNEKLPVSWAALTLLGPAYRFHTELVGVGVQYGRIWRGNLVLKGYGDPTLSSRDLDALAAQVRSAGIRAVTGRVLGDESYYDARRSAPGWKRSFLGDEVAPLSALVVDRAKGWPALSPPLLAARALREALLRAGVSVVGRPGLGVVPRAGLPLASDVSEPLGAIVRRMNRRSDNFLAEMLLKQIAAATGSAGTTAAGARIVLEAMERAGIPVAGLRLADGSGLSSLDRLTATSLVALLRAGASDPIVGPVFVDSLAVTGQSGTLRKRLRRLPGRVKGKTGTTSFASALSGIAAGAFVFAVLENGDPVASKAARKAQDRFATTLVNAAGANALAAP